MKRKLFTIILIMITIFSIIPCNASTNTFDRNELENHGVKKNWAINDRNLQNIMKTKAVDASEKIYDFAEILTEEEEVTLKALIDDFTSTIKMDLVIVTDKISYSRDSENEEYAADFYDYNDFGLDFENTSGILLFRNANEFQPYYDMYTFGNAQLYFDKSRYDDILDSIYDNMKSKNYLPALTDFIRMTKQYIQSGRPTALEGYIVDENGYLQAPPAIFKIYWPYVLGGAGILTLIIIVILINKNRMVKKATEASDYLKRGSIKITNRADHFLTSHTTSHTISSSSGGGGGGFGGGGFSSSGGSSGGGHSSGGGRHG